MKAGNDISIVLDCIPKNEQELKHNLSILYNICNNIHNLSSNCFYSEDELNRIKQNCHLQKKLNIKFI